MLPAAHGRMRKQSHPLLAAPDARLIILAKALLLFLLLLVLLILFLLLLLVLAVTAECLFPSSGSFRYLKGETTQTRVATLSALRGWGRKLR